MCRDRAIDRASQFRDDDPIARLIVHYYEPCDLVHRDYHRVGRTLSRQARRTPAKEIQEVTYLRLWLAMLYAVAEGFSKLKLIDTQVATLLKHECHDRLRLLRNGTFHYQANHTKLSQYFLDGGLGLRWAEHLHAAFGRFFSEYRIEMTVENLLATAPASRSGVEESN